MSEKMTGDGSNSISSPKTDTYRPGTYPNNADEAQQQCDATNTADLTKQGYSLVGVPWLQQYHSTNQYNHVLPPNVGPACSHQDELPRPPTAITPAGPHAAV